MTQQTNDITSTQVNSTFFYVGSVGGNLQESQWITWNKPKDAKFVYILACGGGDGGGGAGSATNQYGMAGLNGNLQSIFVPALLLPDNLYIKLGYGASGGIGQTSSTTNNINERLGGYGGATRVAIYPTDLPGPGDNLIYCFPNYSTYNASSGYIKSSIDAPSYRYYYTYLIDLFVYWVAAGYSNIPNPRYQLSFSYLGFFNIFDKNETKTSLNTDINTITIPNQNQRITTFGSVGGYGPTTDGSSISNIIYDSVNNNYVYSSTPYYLNVVSGGAGTVGGDGTNGIGYGISFAPNALNDVNILGTNGIFSLFFTGGAGGGGGSGVKGGNGGHGGPGSGGGGGGPSNVGIGGNGGDGGPGFVFIQCL